MAGFGSLLRCVETRTNVPVSQSFWHFTTQSACFLSRWFPPWDAPANFFVIFWLVPPSSDMVGTIILELGTPEIHVSVPLLSTMFSANHRIGGNDDYDGAIWNSRICTHKMSSLVIYALVWVPIQLERSKEVDIWPEKATFEWNSTLFDLHDN